MKRVISLLCAIMLLALAVLPLSAAAAEMTDPSYIYFEIPTGAVKWNGFNNVFCHMWSKTGGDVYGWQEKKERCEDMGNGYWRYDVSDITFDPQGEYSLIFSNDTGAQTYNLNITSDCLGDIAYCSGDTCINPVDGQKSCAVARWKYNGDKVYPAIELDSEGVEINVDKVDKDEIETVWGSSTGSAHELPELETAKTKATEKNDNKSLSDDGEVKEDGINTHAATIWIVSISAVVAIAVVVVIVILAKRNKKQK